MADSPDRDLAVEIQDLRFRYPGSSEDVLAIEFLDVEGPGLVALTGANGAGKTTLLELIAGTLREDYQGSLKVLGREWRDLRSDRDRQLHQRRIGLIPQDFGLSKSQTPRQALVQSLSDAQVPGDRHRELIDDALTKVGFDLSMADRPIATLSGGQQQRVAIARALARNVELLIADEPTASLSPHWKKRIMDLLGRIAQEIPVLVITHEAGVAKLCSRQIEFQKTRTGPEPGAFTYIVETPRRWLSALVALAVIATVTLVAEVAADRGPTPAPTSTPAPTPTVGPPFPTPSFSSPPVIPPAVPSKRPGQVAIPPRAPMPPNGGLVAPPNGGLVGPIMAPPPSSSPTVKPPSSSPPVKPPSSSPPVNPSPTISPLSPPVPQGPSPLAAVGSGLAGYTLGGQHVLYLDRSQHVQELWRGTGSSAGWEHFDITVAAGAPPAAAGSGLAGYALGGSNKAAYVDAQGHVHELEWTPTGARHADLTAASGAPLAAVGSGLAGYTLGGQHVLYLDRSQHVQELWRGTGSSAGWEHFDITVAAGAPPAAAGSGLAGYALGGSNKAAYVDGQGHVHELEWTPNGARHADLMG